MIEVSIHDPKWPLYFEEEKEALIKTLGTTLVSIEHIGSTAIASIKAKPVIDIMIGVQQINSFSKSAIKAIESLGYKYNSVFETEFPNRRYFQKNNSEGVRTHQIHLVNYPSAWFEKHVLFRDYLRKYENHAREYENLKLSLAKQFDDTVLYANAKTEFCAQINYKAYFDFSIHKPNVETKRLIGFIPQICCFELYKKMFQDSEFIRCYGVHYDDEKIYQILTRDISYWDKYGFGPYVWFDKATHQFVGEGGLNHTLANDKPEIELTYSLEKSFWGKGLAVEIGVLALHEAFDKLNLQNVVCFTSLGNQQSLRVIEKLNFKYESNFTYKDIAHKLFRIYNK